MRIFRPADLNQGVRLVSTGAYLPERVVTNADLVAAGAPLTDEEMVRATGIRERRYAAPHEATSDLAVHAGRQALERARVPAEAVDRLILATISPDHASPSAACFVQRDLKLAKVPAFDVAASCSGFLFALELGARSVATGDAHVLAIAADVRSRVLNPKDRATCALFGDGAAAAVLAPGKVGEGLLGVGLLTDGAGAHSVYVPAGGSREPASRASVEAGHHFLRMEEGAQVYLAAVEGMIATSEALLQRLSLSFDDVDLVVPHQPNRRILDRMARLARIPEAKLFHNIERVGNVSGATCGLALDAALRGGRAKAGMKVLLVTVGAGYTAAAALLVLDDGLVDAARS